MGRRAKKAPVVTKKRPTLAKQFKCPFCANDNTVECRIDYKSGVGSLKCRMCAASYEMPVHHLHQPIDVFSEWLDDCEAAERGGTSNPGGMAAGSPAAAAAAKSGFADDLGPEDDDDDDLLNDEGLAAADKRSSDKPGRKRSALDDDDDGFDDDDDAGTPSKTAKKQRLEVGHLADSDEED